MSMYDLVRRFAADPLDPDLSAKELQLLRGFYADLEQRFAKAIEAGSNNFQMPGKLDEVRRKLATLNSRLGSPS